MKCVCGCAESSHRTQRLSVDIRTKGQPRHPKAVYEHRPCDCGCCGDYFADDDS